MGINMRICNIFTGGTIGSTLKNDGYIATSNETVFQLLNIYKEQYNCPHDMVNYNPYTLLSEKLDAKHILILIQAVASKLNKNFDGIIIMHGTDTLQYSAAILSIIFNSIDIPILLVSSDYILTDARANGIINYHYAVQFIEAYHNNAAAFGTHNVFVSYANQGGLPTIHCGDLLQPPIPYSSDINSILNNYTGIFKNEAFLPNHAFNPNLSITKSMAAAERFLRLPLCIANKQYHAIQLDAVSSFILRIQPYPGLALPKLSLNTKAIILETYHSGTFCINEMFYQFALDAANANIPVFLTGLNSKENAYETVKHYSEAKIIPVYDTAVIALYCWIWLALSNPH